MASQAVFQSILLFHLTGFVLFAGTTIADFATFTRFRKQYNRGSLEAVAILDGAVKFPLLQRIGIILLILSGVGMMAMTRGVFGEQIWFRIKFGLVIALILNAILAGRRLSLKLGRILNSHEASATGKAEQVSGRLRLFYIAQLLLVFTILLLSVFKFN